MLLLFRFVSFWFCNKSHNNIFNIFTYGNHVSLPAQSHLLNDLTLHCFVVKYRLIGHRFWSKQAVSWCHKKKEKEAKTKSLFVFLGHLSWWVHMTAKKTWMLIPYYHDMDGRQNFLMLCRLITFLFLANPMQLINTKVQTPFCPCCSSSFTRYISDLS